MDITAVIVAIFASVGFWNYILYKVQRRDKKRDEEKTENKDLENLMLGIACHMIRSQCEEYIERGNITTEEYHELQKYLYTPYRNLGGNGTAKRLMEAVDKLPIVKGE